MPWARRCLLRQRRRESRLQHASRSRRPGASASWAYQHPGGLSRVLGDLNPPPSAAVRGPAALARFEAFGPRGNGLAFWDLSGLNLGALTQLKLQNLSPNERRPERLPNWLSDCTALEVLNVDTRDSDVVGNLAPLAGSLRDLTIGQGLARS